MPRFLHLPSPDGDVEEDPLSGIANLFDVSVVFIVGLMITLFSVYRIGDLVDAQSEVTMVWSPSPAAKAASGIFRSDE